jgi:hypothetical protein
MASFSAQSWPRASIADPVAVQKCRIEKMFNSLRPEKKQRVPAIGPVKDANPTVMHH